MFYTPATLAPPLLCNASAAWSVAFSLPPMPPAEMPLFPMIVAPFIIANLRRAPLFFISPVPVAKRPLRHQVGTPLVGADFPRPVPSTDPALQLGVVRAFLDSAQARYIFGAMFVAHAAPFGKFGASFGGASLGTISIPTFGSRVFDSAFGVSYLLFLRADEILVFLYLCA